MQRERPEAAPIETVLVRYYQRQAMQLASADQARHALKKWSDFFPGALVSEVTADRQREFVAHLRGQGLSDGYIRRTLAVGQAAINRALREGEIASAPRISLALAPEGEPRERLLTLTEAASLFAAADIDHLRIYLLLAFGTAARPAAILELTTFQIDCDARLIRLNPPGRRQTKKRRPTLPMCDTLLPYLRALHPGPAVAFNGRAIKSIDTAFDRARDRAGLSKDVTPYTIRHTVAAEMRKRGVLVWEVSGWLGHTSGYKTTERYAKFDPDHLGGAVRAIDAYFADLWSAVASSSPQIIPQPIVRASCVRARPSNLVEPTGIEPVTSTMPL
jgi:integrase